MQLYGNIDNGGSNDMFIGNKWFLDDGGTCTPDV